MGDVFSLPSAVHIIIFVEIFQGRHLRAGIDRYHHSGNGVEKRRLLSAKRFPGCSVKEVMEFEKIQKNPYYFGDLIGAGAEYLHSVLTGIGATPAMVH